MKGTIIAAVALAGGIISAAPASAADPEAGSPCQGSQLNNTATTSSGTAVRCLANEQNGFSWMADTGAAGTIAQLEGEGYTVNIDRVGSASLDKCTVTNVRNPITTTRTNRSHSGAGGVDTIVVSKTIDVSLDCTG
jgi:hypothetical protein